ncbi:MULTISPECIES: hypothetical protein [unclassified Streptomyces]|uniref:hypothetical protein n=1 Tax=unclassified Streptomyces TaxID=2593676 RepID=UPI00381F038C
MIKQILAGAAFATAATMAIAAPASANTAPPAAAKTPANTLQNILTTTQAKGPTTSGTGTGCSCGTANSTVGSLTGSSGNPTNAVSSLTGNATSTVGTVGNLTGTTVGDLTGTGTSTGAGGASSGSGATDFATSNGNTVIGGEAGGILNTYGASLVNVDLRCAVPLPEGEGIGGHALGSPKTACNVAPVNQYQAPQKLL